ncbi:hypothetical protein JCM8208_006344 [Rhodotorula glutinis]
MAAPVAPPDGDPFPLLHLADLDFALSSSSLADLAAYQLALAPWSTSWDDSMAAALKRTWRRRREKARPLITAREPMGVYAPLELQQREQFPRFECVDLAFDLDPANDDLDHLSSAQLAAVQFHPAATKDLVAAAEDVFFTRRERDFAAGLALPPFPPSASTSSTPSASAPVPATHTPAPHAAAPTSASTMQHAVADARFAPPSTGAPTTSRLPPRLTVTPSLPPASSTPAGTPPRPAAATKPVDVLAGSSTPAPSSSSRLPALARPPAPPGAAQPQSSSSASVSASGSRVPAGPSEGTSAREDAGERERARYDESRRDRERDYEPAARRDRSRDRDRDYDATRSRDRASSSRRSERERERSLSPGTAQRERERAAYKAAKAARAREDEERERERAERRRRDGDDEREEGRRARQRSVGRSSRDEESRRRSERDRDERDGGRHRDERDERDRERASGSRRSSSRAYSRARSRSRSPATRRDSGHESSFATPASAGRKRAASPARSDYSHASAVLRSSTRRRLDDADYASAPGRASSPPTGPRRKSPTPEVPRASESVPLELLSRLHTVFLRHFPGRLSPTDVFDFVRHGAPTTRAEPIAIKAHSRPNQDFGQPGEAGLEPDVTLAFVLYAEDDEDSARELIRCTDRAMFRGRKIKSVMGVEQTTSSWRWSDFNPRFVDKHYRRQLAAHAARHPPPEHADARYQKASTGVLGGRAPPSDHAPVPHASRSAGPSVDTGSARRRASTAAPPPTPLPAHLHAALPTLYVSNVAADTTLGECRDFFDPCEGLVGLSLSGVSSSLRALRFRDAWLAFESAPDRERARHALMGGKYPGAAVKLWVEMAELRARNQGEEHQWLWSEMSKDYRSRHQAELDAASHGSAGDAAGDGAGARTDYSASNPPTPRLQQQQQQAPQGSPTVDPRRRPSQQFGTTNPSSAPATMRFFPAGQPLPLSSTVDPFMSASSSSSASNGPAGPPSRLPTLAQAPPPPDAYSPLAAALPFGTLSTSHAPPPHAYSASHQHQQHASSAPTSRPSTGVPRPGPQTVPGSGPSAYPSDSTIMRPPSAPATTSTSAPPPPPPSAPRGAGFMDPARAALLASSGAAGPGDVGLGVEPMQLDDDERSGGGERRPTAAEEKARAEEAARSAWGARRGGAATATGAQAQQEGVQQQLQAHGSPGQQDDDGRPRSFSLGLGIKGRAGSSATGTSAETRSPAATPSTILDRSPASASATATPAPAVDAVAADVAPSISASALQALGAALTLQGLPGALDAASDEVGEGAGSGL